MVKFTKDTVVQPIETGTRSFKAQLNRDIFNSVLLFTFNIFVQNGSVFIRRMIWTQLTLFEIRNFTLKYIVSYITIF
jgi:hypothetical protein